MPSCRELSDLASGYLAGELSPWRRFTVRVHLWMCRSCRRYVAQIEQVIAALARLGDGAGEPPSPLAAELRAELARLRAGHES